jgi:hypothetical protein
VAPERSQSSVRPNRILVDQCRHLPDPRSSQLFEITVRMALEQFLDARCEFEGSSALRSSDPTSLRVDRTALIDTSPPTIMGRLPCELRPRPDELPEPGTVRIHDEGSPNIGPVAVVDRRERSAAPVG